MVDFNWVDYVVLGILFISMLFGLIRGFVKEVIALLTWIVAFIISSLFATRLALYFSNSEQVRSAISSNIEINSNESASLLATGVSFFCIFLGILILGKLLSFFISSIFEGRGIGFGNRLLGGIFGLARGFLLVLLIMFLVNLSPVSEQFYWKESRLVASFQPAVQELSNIVQPGIESLKTKMGEKIKNVSQQYFQGGEQAFKVFPDRG